MLKAEGFPKFAVGRADDTSANWVEGVSMTEIKKAQIALQDGVEYRSVDLALEANGSLDLSAQDVGPMVREYWGDSDYEYGIRIYVEDMSKFAFALIVEFCKADLDSVDRLRKIAEENDIDPHYWYHI